MRLCQAKTTKQIQVDPTAAALSGAIGGFGIGGQLFGRGGNGGFGFGGGSAPMPTYEMNQSGGSMPLSLLWRILGGDSMAISRPKRSNEPHERSI